MLSGLSFFNSIYLFNVYNFVKLFKKKIGRDLTHTAATCIRTEIKLIETCMFMILQRLDLNKFRVK